MIPDDKQATPIPEEIRDEYYTLQAADSPTPEAIVRMRRLELQFPTLAPDAAMVRRTSKVMLEVTEAQAENDAFVTARAMREAESEWHHLEMIPLADLTAEQVDIKAELEKLVPEYIAKRAEAKAKAEAVNTTPDPNLAWQAITDEYKQWLWLVGLPARRCGRLENTRLRELNTSHPEFKARWEAECDASRQRSVLQTAKEREDAFAEADNKKWRQEEDERQAAVDLAAAPAKLLTLRETNLEIATGAGKEEILRKTEGQMRERIKKRAEADKKEKVIISQLLLLRAERQKEEDTDRQDLQRLQADDPRAYGETFYTGGNPVGTDQRLEDMLLGTPLPSGLKPEAFDQFEGVPQALPELWPVVWQAYCWGCVAGHHATKPRGFNWDHEPDEDDDEDANDGDFDWVAYSGSEIQGFESIPSFWAGVFESAGGWVNFQGTRHNQHKQQVPYNHPEVRVKGLGPLLRKRFKQFLGPVVKWPDPTSRREYRFSGVQARSIVEILYADGRLPFRWRREATAILKWQAKLEGKHAVAVVKERPLEPVIRKPVSADLVGLLLPGSTGLLADGPSEPGKSPAVI